MQGSGFPDSFQHIGEQGELIVNIDLVDPVNRVPGGSPGCPAIANGRQGHPDEAGERAYLSAQKGAIEKIRIPGAQPAWSERIDVACRPIRCAGGVFKDIADYAEHPGPVDARPEQIEPAPVEAADADPMAGQMQRDDGADLAEVAGQIAKIKCRFESLDLDVGVFDIGPQGEVHLGEQVFQYALLLRAQVMIRGGPPQPSHGKTAVSEHFDLRSGVRAGLAHPEIHQLFGDVVDGKAQIVVDGFGQNGVTLLVFSQWKAEFAEQFQGLFPAGNLLLQIAPFVAHQFGTLLHGPDQIPHAVQGLGVSAGGDEQKRACRGLPGEMFGQFEHGADRYRLVCSG